MIGDYANLEKLNGNFDLLDAMDMQVSGYDGRTTIDKHDWKTWPAWMVREIGHTDNRRLLNHINCDCGSCKPAYDSMRDEAYCFNCGFIAGQRSKYIQVEEDYETVREKTWENDPEVKRQREEDESMKQWIATPEVTQERKPQKRDYDAGKIHILWVYSDEEITTEDPITGEPITERVKVQLKVARDVDSWEAINPVTGKMDTPDGITYLGRDQLRVAQQRAAIARFFFEDHNETCMVGNNHGHPDNCRECRRLFNRMMKKGAELQRIRDRLTLQV